MITAPWPSQSTQFTSLPCCWRILALWKRQCSFLEREIFRWQLFMLPFVPSYRFPAAWKFMDCRNHSNPFRPNVCKREQSCFNPTIAKEDCTPNGFKGPGVENVVGPHHKKAVIRWWMLDTTLSSHIGIHLSFVSIYAMHNFFWAFKNHCLFISARHPSGKGD